MEGHEKEDMKRRDWIVKVVLEWHRSIFVRLQLGLALEEPEHIGRAIPVWGDVRIQPSFEDDI